MERYELDCEKQYDDNLWEYRAIDRYVWYQIKNMIKDDSQLGEILMVDEDGILRVNMNSNLLTKEQKNCIFRLIANQRDGIFRNHQLKDLNAKIESKEEYNKWFDEKAMNSFMLTIPTKEIFYNYPVETYRIIKESHIRDELNRQNFEGYSIWQTLYALDMINPCLVGTLLGEKISIEKKGRNTYIKFKYKNEIIYSRMDSIYLFTVADNRKLVKLDNTIHTLLFKHYQEPIYKTLNSIMYPIGGYRVLPSEGHYDDPMIPELTEKTEEILNSENYKKLEKEYHLNYSRVSSRGY